MVSARSETGMMATRFHDTLGRSTGYAINGTRQTTIAYDANNQLLQVRNATPTNIISQFDYTYDAAGRRTAIAKSGTSFGDLSGSIDSYTYNARSELISARRTKNGQPIPGFSEDFDYDPIGNRRSSATYNERGEAQTSIYQANNLNQYTQRTTPGYAAVRGEADPNATVTVNENPTFRFGSYYFGSDLFDNTTAGGLANLETYATLSQTAANGDETDDLISSTTNQVYLAQSSETFAYDADGNQTLITTKTGLWRVTYNGENRPIRWERDSDTETLMMAYDHMGRRRAKNAQRFFYDGYLQVADDTGNSYTWDCTETIATRPLAWLCGNIPACYVHDGNKNVSEAISVDGSLVAHYEYLSFGVLAASYGTSATANPWRFSSEYSEDNLGLVYYLNRYCDQTVGIWLSRDPYNEEEDTFFVDNDPIGAFDWLGLEWEYSSCVSISHSKNFDFRNKPLRKRIGLLKFKGTLAFGYSLKGEACLKCCKKGSDAGLKKWSGSGAVSLTGEGGGTATYGVDFKTDLFWNYYRMYLFGGIQASLVLSASGTGSFEFDGCDGEGTLNASISDTLGFAFRGGVEGLLKRRGSRRNGNWHYNRVAAVSALAKGTVSSSLSTTLSCNTEKCILTSSFGGVDANIGIEFAFGRKTFSWDIWRFHHDGFILAETEFESPLKDWME